MTVLLGAIGATKSKAKAKTPVFHYDLYKFGDDGLKFVKQVKIRRMKIYAARQAMEDYIIKLKKTKPGFYRFELNKVTGEEGRSIY